MTPAINLQATSVQSDYVDLLWSNGENQTSVQVQRRTGTGNWANISTALPATTTTFTDANASPSSSYEYRIKSSNADGSVYSEAISVVTPSGIADTPPNLRADNITNSSVRVLWDTVQDADFYRIRYKKVLVTAWNSSGAISHPTAFSDLSGLESDVTYQVQVRSENAFGNSPWSSSFEFKTALGLPSAATNLNFTNVAPESLTLNWTNNGGQTSIIVQRKTGTGTWANITGALASNTTTINDSGLTPSTEYYYRIRSSNGSGTVYSSAEAVITDQEVISSIVLSSPSKDYKSISLSWTEVAGAVGYRLHMSKAGVSQGYVYPTVEQTAFTYTNLDFNTAYSFYIEAQDSSGAWYVTSNTVNVSTDPYPTSLAVSPTYINVNQPAGDFKVELLSNENWAVTSNPSWVSFSGISGNGDDIFTVLYEANNTGSERTGYITLTEGVSGASVQIQVVQDN